MRLWFGGFLLTIFLCLGLLQSQSLQKLDYIFFDSHSAILRSLNPRPAIHDVVVVGIDEASIRAFDEPLILWHQHIADFLNIALEAKVAGIGVDIVLPERSMNRYLPGQDELLIKAMLNARLSVPFEIAITYNEVGAPNPIFPAYMAAVGRAGVGLAIFPKDRDQVVRRFDERLATDGSEISTFAGNLARLLGSTPVAGYIDYTLGSRFNYIPLHELLQQAQPGQQASLKNSLKDKVVLLGVVIAGVDRVAQSVALAAGDEDKLGPGVMVQAQALRSMLNGGLPQPVALPIIVLLIIVSSLFWFIPLRPSTSALTLLVLLAILQGVALLIQVNGNILTLAAIQSSLTLAILGRQGVEKHLRRSERLRLKLAFSGYVSPAIMREIERGTLTPSSKGTLAEVCVMFADIRDYTSISEHMKPEEVITFLNRYYEGVVRAIHDEGGSVISFMGDGIMAVFGAPNLLKNPCLAGLNASKAMLAFVTQLNSLSEASNSPHLKIGIGLHVGMAVMGHIGTAVRHDYSAIGDVTNTASRIEGLTKALGFSIVCSRAVFEAIGQPAECKPLGEKAIKGRSAIEVFGINVTNQKEIL